MKIYTRTGDAGTTSLVGGERRRKDDSRVEAYGTIDELNSFMAVVTTHPDCASPQKDILIFVQQRLFNIGAYLADPRPEAPVPVSAADVERLEVSIDEMNDQIPPINRFILPGGSQLSAHVNVCRAVARRAERRIVTVACETEIAPVVMKFVNRLSDWLFEYSRFVNFQLDCPETFWEK